MTTPKGDMFGLPRVKDADPEKFAELTRRAMGNRTQSEFANSCGFNVSTISRILGKKNSGPSADYVIAQIALNADPSSGVTIEELLDAQGKAIIPGARDPHEVLAQVAQMDSAISVQNGRASANPYFAVEGILPKEMSLEQSRRMNAYAFAMQDVFKQSSAYRQAILDALMVNGYMVALDKEDRTAIKGAEFNCVAHFVLKTDALEKEELTRWAFVIVKEIGNQAVYSMLNYFGMMFLNNPLEDKKRVTFIIEDLQTYLLLMDSYHDAAIPASVSFMYVDNKERCIGYEFVLSKSDDTEAVKLFSDGELLRRRLFGRTDAADSDDTAADGQDSICEADE